VASVVQVLLFLPKIIDRRKSTMNIKNNTLAMPAALAAIPPKPNTAAMIAIIKNTTDHRSIT
jgi:hypothetical protein